MIELQLPRSSLYSLTRREIQVLQCISDGLTSKEIANELSISQFTVANHRKNMINKMGARNSLELAYRLKKLRNEGQLR